MLVYAPSVAIMPSPAYRPYPAPASPRSLLTVADPAYPRRKDEKTERLPDSSLILPPSSLQLPSLPHTAREAECISRFFDPQQVLALRGARATEKALAAALPGRHVVHIAAH